MYMDMAYQIYRRLFAQQQPAISASKAPVIENAGAHVILSANGIAATFDTANGMLKEIRRDGQIVPFGNGPLPVGMKADLKSITTRTDGNDALLIVKYTGALDTVIWRMTPDGLLGMDALMLNRGNGGKYKGEFFDKKVYQLGLTFSYPEKEAKGMRWLGRGPYRVWKIVFQAPTTVSGRKTTTILSPAKVLKAWLILNSKGITPICIGLR